MDSFCHQSCAVFLHLEVFDLIHPFRVIDEGVSNLLEKKNLFVF